MYGASKFHDGTSFTGYITENTGYITEHTQTTLEIMLIFREWRWLLIVDVFRHTSVTVNDVVQVNSCFTSQMIFLRFWLLW